MNKALNSDKKRTFRIRPSAVPRPDAKEITSLDDIPEFNDVESERRFWKSHTVSKELLDQIPEPEPEEQ